MSSDYTFNFTDPTVDSILVPTYHVDGPVTPITNTAVDHISNLIHYPITTTSPTTTLVLVGKGVADYGETIQQNLLYMLEHFANGVAPINPLIGQLWFNKNLNVLNVYTSNNTWVSLFNSTGGVVSGPIALTGLITDNNHATTKLYVDTMFNSIDTNLQLSSSYNEVNGNLEIQVGNVNSANNTTVYIPPVSELAILAQYNEFNEELTVSLSNGQHSIVKITKPTIARTKIISAGESIFFIPEYIVNSNRLWIFVNGVKQILDDDYIETDSTTVTFTLPQAVGVKLEFLYI
jgi:hypothetical protein